MKKTKETKCQKSSNINTVKSSKLSFVFRPFSSILLVLRRLEFLGLYSYLKIQPSLGRRSSSFQSGSSIKRLAKLRITGYFATVALLFLSIATISPIYIEHTPAEATAGTETKSNLTFASTSSMAKVKLNVTSKDGTFATSDENEKIKFTLSTNNATGYTLSIRAASNMDKVTLSNGSSDGVIEPLPEDPSGNGVSATTYASNSSAGQAYNNTWGYIPSYYHSSANTNTYYRAPNTTTGETLRKTNTANSSNGIDNADSYSIGLGIRANYAKASGTYTSDNVLVLEYVANPVAYSISFANDTGDNSIDSTLPATISGTSIPETSVTLPSATPTRTGYTFSKWCLGTVSNNGTTCTGTLFDAGGDFGIDQTISPNSATLYAVWTIKTYTITIARNNSGYGATSPESLSLPYGTALPTSGTTSTSITLGNTTVTATPTTQTSQYAYSFTNWTHGCGAAVTNNCTITANFTRTDVYTITWNPNNGSVSPTTTTRISGEQIGELPTPTRDGYDFLGWFTAASGGSQISASTTVTGNVTYWAQWKKAIITFGKAFAGKEKLNGYYKMQDMTTSICSAVTAPATTTEDISTQLIDTRDNKIYWVSKLLDGNCWMTQNLDYDVKASGNEVAVIGGTTTTTWNSSYSPTATSTAVFNNSSYTGTYSYDPGSKYLPSGTGSATNITCTAASNGGDNCHYHLGNYYQWNAATAGYGGTEKNKDIAYSICPKGWRLPTSNSTTANYSFGKLTTAYSISSNAAGATALISSPLWFVRAGYVLYGSLNDQGTFGYVWSSRADSNTGGAYNLLFYSTYVYPSRSSLRNVGNSVRCVAE